MLLQVPCGCGIPGRPCQESEKHMERRPKRPEWNSSDIVSGNLRYTHGNRYRPCFVKHTQIGIVIISRRVTASFCQQNETARLAASANYFHCLYQLNILKYSFLLVIAYSLMASTRAARNVHR